MTITSWSAYIWSFSNPAKEFPLINIESTFIVHLLILVFSVFITYCTLLLSLKSMRNRDDLLFVSGVLFAMGIFLTYWHMGIGGLVIAASKVLQSIKNNG